MRCPHCDGTGVSKYIPWEVQPVNVVKTWYSLRYGINFLYYYNGSTKPHLISDDAIAKSPTLRGRVEEVARSYEVPMERGWRLISEEEEFVK